MGQWIGGNGLQPRIIDRVRQALRPEWTRSGRVRQIAAAALVVAAAVSWLVDTGETDQVAVLTAGRDLPAGTDLNPGDLQIRHLPADLVPDDAMTDDRDLTGKAVAGPVATGEVITDARLRTADLPQRLTGRADARLVPVRPADDSVSELLAYGDVVDVVDEQADVLARDAVVAVTAEAGERSLTASGEGRPVLLAMSEAAAHRVAAAGLGAAITIVLH